MNSSGTNSRTPNCWETYVSKHSL